MSHRAVTEVEIEGRRVRLSNLDKVLRPDAGFTKGQMIDHYRRISAELLPTCRSGRSRSSAFPTASTTSSSTRSAVRRTGHHGSPRARSAAAAEPASRSTTASSGICRRWSGWPTWPRSNCTRCWRAADTSTTRPWWCSTSILARRQISSTAARSACGSGTSSTGSACSRSGSRPARRAPQLYVPLNTPHSYADTKPFARSIARLLAERHPDRVVERMDKSLRAAKVLTTGARTTPARPLSAPIPCVPVNVPRSPPLSPGRRSNEDCTTTTRPSYSSRQPTSSSGYGGSVTSSNRCAASNRSFLDSADLRPAS